MKPSYPVPPGVLKQGLRMYEALKPILAVPATLLNHGLSESLGVTVSRIVQPVSQPECNMPKKKQDKASTNGHAKKGKGVNGRVQPNRSVPPPPDNGGGRSDPSVKPNEGVPAAPDETPMTPAVVEVKPNLGLAGVIEEIRSIQRARSVLQKSRMMVANRVKAIVAGTLGYKAELTDKERDKMYAKAEEVIKAIAAGRHEHPTLHAAIKLHLDIVESLMRDEKGQEDQLARYARKLPVAKWFKRSEQCGVDMVSLGKIVGECGDLANYSNPGKLWRRMGCAPYTSEDKTLMGSTWRRGKEGSLDKAEWQHFGYSPRRRSIMYVIAAGLVRQNGTGPYRTRWLDAKKRAYARHPEWDWKPCKGPAQKGCPGDATCPTCGGLGKTCGRAHLHGMLLAAKLLLKNLWLEWNNHPPRLPGAWQPPEGE